MLLPLILHEYVALTTSLAGTHMSRFILSRVVTLTIMSMAIMCCFSCEDHESKLATTKAQTKVAAPNDTVKKLQDTSAIAKLPNGVTIKLIGIAKSPRTAIPTTAPNADTWFSPLGVPIAAPYTSLADNFRELDAGNTKSVTDHLQSLRSTGIHMSLQ